MKPPKPKYKIGDCVYLKAEKEDDDEPDFIQAILTSADYYDEKFEDGSGRQWIYGYRDNLHGKGEIAVSPEKDIIDKLSKI